ncbi:MAG TPA: DinB family protein [Terracidiphilus sp.]|jgi:hypothetical protein|nr:DinB family protein [Terracidiphilus sp.]
MDDAIIAQQFVRQYLATLAMLRQAIQLCPEELWLDSSYTNRFWHIAYHSVFYTHFYVQGSEESFRAWEHHQNGSNHLGSRAGEQKEARAQITPYTREQVLEYLKFCCDQIAERLPLDTLEAESGFSWLSFNRFEVHLYTLRHLAHHTGQLADRLRVVAHVGMPWVRQG